jgi:hypothetical protein
MDMFEKPGRYPRLKRDEDRRDNSGPYTRDACAAESALPLFKIAAEDLESPPLNDHLAAFVAVGVFRSVARDVTDIHILES